MAARDCARTAGIAGSPIEEVLEEREWIVVSNPGRCGFECEQDTVAAATDWIERILEPIATERREDPRVSGGGDARGG